MRFWDEAAREKEKEKGKEKWKEKWCLIGFILNHWIIFMPRVINQY